MRTVRATVGAGAGHRDVFAGPAVGAEHVAREPDCGDEVVDRLERERREVQLLADVLDHPLVGLAVRIDVLRDIRALALLAADVAAGDEVVLVLRAREVDEAAGIEKRGTRDADVRLLAALAVEAVRLLAELGAADDRVVAEDEPAVLDEELYIVL